jgi:Uma2 family endonuclease
MNIALRTPMSLDAFLAWEERQALRYEFDGFAPVAMTGGTAAHSAIQRNLLFALTGRLQGKRCQPHGSELKIQVTGRIRYPDAFVVCTPVEARATVVTEPVVIFEVLSDSSENDDLVVKNAEYRATPSVQHYAILQQHRAGGIVFSRKGDEWVSELLPDVASLPRLPAIGLEIALTEIYAGLGMDAVAVQGAERADAMQKGQGPLPPGPALKPSLQNPKTKVPRTCP